MGEFETNDILASRGLASERLFDFSQKICGRRLFSKVGQRSKVKPEISKFSCVISIALFEKVGRLLTEIYLENVCHLFG